MESRSITGISPHPTISRAKKPCEIRATVLGIAPEIVNSRAPDIIPKGQHIKYNRTERDWYRYMVLCWCFKYYFPSSLSGGSTGKCKENRVPPPIGGPNGTCQVVGGKGGGVGWTLAVALWWLARPSSTSGSKGKGRPLSLPLLPA